MNGYFLSRQYFDWAFEHPNENNPTMTALYLFIVEINNRLGWKEVFSITPRECLEGIGLSSYPTYKKYFDKLVETGFIKIHKASKNQYQANIIALSKIDNPSEKALDNTIYNSIQNNESALSNFCNANDNSHDKADEKHLPTQVESYLQSTFDIHKTTNNKLQTNSSNSNELLCETSQPHAENINYKELINWFNEKTKGVFGKLKYPISEQRRGMLRARIREHGKETFCDVIVRASQSDFLKGNNNKSWKATFDWIIKPTNFEKILSGNYDNKNNGHTQTAGLDEEFARNIAEGIARANYENGQVY